MEREVANGANDIITLPKDSSSKEKTTTSDLKQFRTKPYSRKVDAT